jgi:hypothetical protein
VVTLLLSDYKSDFGFTQIYKGDIRVIGKLI